MKLLDAGERLPVHVHPDDVFARDTLRAPYGKTEAWIVIATTRDDASVAAGLREDVAPRRCERWVREQDHDALLGALNPIPVKAGDAIFVPAGTPHAIGEGVLIVELQQPTDISVLLEWDGFGIADEDEATLGLGWDVALGCVELAACDAAALRGPDPTRRASRAAAPAAADAVLPRRPPRAGADRRARARLRDPRRHRGRGRAAGRERRAAARPPRRHGARAVGGGPVPPRGRSRRNRLPSTGAAGRRAQ